MAPIGTDSKPRNSVIFVRNVLNLIRIEKNNQIARAFNSVPIGASEAEPVSTGSTSEPAAFDERILQQDFYYLDRGSQAFVFLSADGLYVLKLFFFDSPRPTISQRFLNCRKEGLCQKIEKKIAQLTESCRLAFLHAQEETGLIYVHLNPTDQEGRVRLHGPAWHQESVEIYRTRFAIQRFVTPLKEALLDARRRNDRKAFDAKILAVKALLQRRSALGLRNCDRSLIENCGFLGDMAIEIDFANYVSARDRREWGKAERHLHEWIQEAIAPW